MARILVSIDSEEYPEVKLHTTKLGTITAKLSDVQPYEQQNLLTKQDKYVYEASISSDEIFMMVSVKEQGVSVPRSVQTAVHITECTGGSILSEIPELEFEEIDPSAAQIFDVKVDIDGVTQPASVAGLYTESDVVVTGIVSSDTALDTVDLKLVPIGESIENSIALTMSITEMPLVGLYSVNATIPAALVTNPAISYWIAATNADGESTSVPYTLGAKPDGVVSANIELDYDTNEHEGRTLKADAYVTVDKPAYGTVSLLIDGTPVSVQSGLFVSGDTKVDLDWITPKVGADKQYEVQAKLDLYGDVSQTSTGVLYTYDRTQSVSIANLQTISPVTAGDKTIATPALVYASNSDSSLQFRVTDPAGHCIIGSDDSCAVTGSTYAMRGDLASVEHDGQIYRVKYSGSDNVLERFSITSIDPIQGDWTVTLESTDDTIPQAYAMPDVSLKIKYRTISNDVTLR